MSLEVADRFRFNEKDDPGLIEYLKDHNIDSLKDYIITKIKENGLENVNLVTIAKINNDTAGLVKELVISNQIDNNELANQIAKEIITDIELQVDRHLKKYKKFTLNAPPISSANSRDEGQDESISQFFNLISLLKDVSVLGRKLLEMAPHFNTQKSTPSTPAQVTTRVLSSAESDTMPNPAASTPVHLAQVAGKFAAAPGACGGKNLKDEDATSEDLLAALIESSSSDDFLVLSSSLETITIKEMILASMIYIKSHECFTLSHDIQGVVMVLRRTKFIILNILAPKNQVELITKLLTSISRYNEMNYVFDLLRDRNQFEVLLSKGVEKTPELRIALFNYVKKNPEFYALVTLNFSMFREIAESLEASANKRLNKLKKSTGVSRQQAQQQQSQLFKKRTSLISSGSNFYNSASNSVANNLGSLSISGQQGKDFLDAQCDISQADNSNMSSNLNSQNLNSNSQSSTTAETKMVPYSRENLNLSLVELVDASDCYSKAGCYKKSNNCERKAKLVALQIALLNSNNGLNVLDVEQANLIEFISSFKNFKEAYIVADAYDFHSAWRQALFKNVLLEGNGLYLENYCQKCHLSSALVEELVLLYRQHVNNNQQASPEENSRMLCSLKSLISKLKNVELKCKLYNQLNLLKAREELLQDLATQAHLRDLKLVQ